MKTLSRQDSTPDQAPSKVRTIAIRDLAKRYEAMLFVALGLLVLYLSFASEFFLTFLNIKNVLLSVSVTAILSVPLTLLLVAGYVDISGTSIAAFSGMLFVIVTDGGRQSIAFGVVMALVVGLAVGVLNGALVAGLRLNPIITTLGTLAVFRGATKLISNGQTELLFEFRWLGSGTILEVPVQIILASAIVVAAGLILHKTVRGRHIYAIGSSPEAARLAGIPLRRKIFLLFALNGLLAGLAGLVVLSQLGAASPVVLEGQELTVITGVIIGGASLSGGKGTMVGTVIGFLLLGTLNNGLTLLSVTAFWQEIAQGAVLIGAITFDQLRETRTRA